jgi:HSP90 family molecular chaperone
MLAQKVEVETYKQGFQPLKIEIEDVFDYFVIRQGKRNSPGTTISLYNSNPVFKGHEINEVLRYYATHLDIPITVRSGANMSIIKNTEFTADKDALGLDKERYSLYDIKVDSEYMEGIISFPVEKNSVPADGIREFSRHMALSLNGIRVEDKSILPEFLTIYYVDINFKGNALSLDASRKHFPQDGMFNTLKNHLELVILEKFEDIITLFHLKIQR